MSEEEKKKILQHLIITFMYEKDLPLQSKNIMHVNNFMA